MEKSKQAAAASAVDGKVMGAVSVQSTASPVLTGFAMLGAIVLLVSPMFTFVGHALKEGSVEDLTVYPYLLGLFNSVAWVLYAVLSHPSLLPFIAMNGVGILLHLFYVIFYIWFATGKKRAHALILLFTVVAVSVVMASLVTNSMVFTIAWSTTIVSVMASASGASMHIAPVFDVVRLMKRKQQLNNMNTIKALLSLFNGIGWIAYALVFVPVNLYVLVPNLIGFVSALLQITVYLVYLSNSLHIDAADYGHEMRELSKSPV